MNEQFQEAADAIAMADGMIIGAGAGMGVDSGMPDFRGNQGFWQAYPPYEQLGLQFMQMANPQWFHDDPEMAWGFYGHRGNLYRATEPHEGFEILRRWSEQMQQGSFVYTSNVDGHFQKAGFDADRILEVHGSVHHRQCMRPACPAGIWEVEEDDAEVIIDESTMRAQDPLPKCPKCGSLARPNILMFGDAEWDYARSLGQENQFRSWHPMFRRLRLVIVECGAGTAIPTVRILCEDMAERYSATLIRINVREPGVPRGQISFPLGALEALQNIDERMPKAYREA